MGGPLLSWLPLLLLGSDRGMMATVIGWYLTFIVPVRHTKLWLRSGFDPSGHVFVYGAQLIPHAWMPRPNRAVGMWSTVLLYLSGTTSAFFHRAAETFTGWLLIVILYAMLATRMQLTTRKLVGTTCVWSLATGIFVATSPMNAMRAGEIAYDLVLFMLLAYLTRPRPAPEPGTSPGERKTPDEKPTPDEQKKLKEQQGDKRAAPKKRAGHERNPKA